MFAKDPFVKTPLVKLGQGVRTYFQSVSDVLGFEPPDIMAPICAYTPVVRALKPAQVVVDAEAAAL